MSEAPNIPQKPADDPIELEPVVKADIPRYVLKSEAERAMVQDSGGPVPPFPRHVCEQCDYDLRGLRSRECPECGTPFTLQSARRAGLIHNPRTRQDLTIALKNRIVCKIGIVLVAMAFVLPLSTDFSTTQMFFSVSRILPILTFAFMYKVWAQTTWAHVILVAGLTALLIESSLMLF